MAFPDSGSVLDKFQPAKQGKIELKQVLGLRRCLAWHTEEWHLVGGSAKLWESGALSWDASSTYCTRDADRRSLTITARKGWILVTTLVATIHFSPFACFFRRFWGRSFTFLFFFRQQERRIHRITLTFTIHYPNARANGSLTTPITFTY